MAKKPPTLKSARTLKHDEAKRKNKLPGVNHLGTYGRWAFAEFTEVYQIEADFAKKVEAEFDKMIARLAQ